jgi:heme-degrading monooxygenase HmoA
VDGNAGNDNVGIRTTDPLLRRRYLGSGEPPINELLTDPIAALLRRSDGLSLDDVRRCIADIMARRAFRAGRSGPFHLAALEHVVRSGKLPSPTREPTAMFIAMNRFKVRKGEEAAFERRWRERDSHLQAVPGFLEFHLLKGPERDDHVLYASHSSWLSRAEFEAWTRSEAFRAAHRNAGEGRPLTLGHPEFEGFDVLDPSE